MWFVKICCTFVNSIFVNVSGWTCATCKISFQQSLRLAIALDHWKNDCFSISWLQIFQTGKNSWIIHYKLQWVVSVIVMNLLRPKRGNRKGKPHSVTKFWNRFGVGETEFLRNVRGKIEIVAFQFPLWNVDTRLQLLVAWHPDYLTQIVWFHVGSSNLGVMISCLLQNEQVHAQFFCSTPVDKQMVHKRI